MIAKITAEHKRYFNTTENGIVIPVYTLPMILPNEGAGGKGR